MKWALLALAGAGMLIIGISRDWIHVEYTVPQEAQTAPASVTDVEVGKDGKLKLFDSSSKYFRLITLENNPFGCNSH